MNKSSALLVREKGRYVKAFGGPLVNHFRTSQNLISKLQKPKKCSCQKHKQKLEEVAPKLAKSVPVSKYKTLSPRKASTPSSPTRKSESTSPIGQALYDLEKTVSKKLNLAVSVTANLEGLRNSLLPMVHRLGISQNEENDVKFDLNVSKSTQFFDDYYNDHMASLEINWGESVKTERSV